MYVEAFNYVPYNRGPDSVVIEKKRNFSILSALEDRQTTLKSSNHAASINTATDKK